MMSKYVKVDVPQQDKVQQVISRRQQSKFNLLLLCTRECTHSIDRQQIERTQLYDYDT